MRTMVALRQSRLPRRLRSPPLLRASSTCSPSSPAGPTPTMCIKVVLKKPVPLIVDSVGGKGDRGDFVLIDTVHEGDKPVRQRKWIMHPAGPDRFTGTLTDAVGPVDVQIDGDSATHPLHDEGRTEDRAGAHAPARRQDADQPRRGEEARPEVRARRRRRSASWTSSSLATNWRWNCRSSAAGMSETAAKRRPSRLHSSIAKPSFSNDRVPPLSPAQTYRFTTCSRR